MSSFDNRSAVLPLTWPENPPICRNGFSYPCALFVVSIRQGLIANIIGMFLTILGAQALAGIVLIKSLNVPQGTFNVASNPSQFVNSVDLLIVQANTNTILAHFTGIVTSLWLLNRITSK